MDFTFIDAPTHSTGETLSKFQARISEFSGTVNAFSAAFRITVNDFKLNDYFATKS